MKKGISLLTALLVIMLFAFSTAAQAAQPPVDAGDGSAIAETIADTSDSDAEDPDSSKDAEQIAEEDDMIELGIVTPIIVATCSVLFIGIVTLVIFLARKNMK